MTDTEKALLKLHNVYHELDAVMMLMTSSNKQYGRVMDVEITLCDVIHELAKERGDTCD